MKDIFTSTELSSVIISVICGKDYAQEISKELKRTPATIVRQLQKIEKNKFLTSKKEKLLNRKRYYPNWEKLSRTFGEYHFIGMEAQKEKLDYLFQTPFFQNLFSNFVKSYTRISKRVSLRYIFDEFITAIPQSNHKVWLEKIPDKKLKDNLGDFIWDCKEFNYLLKSANAIDEAVVSALSEAS